MRIAVTGGGGELGRALTPHLLAAGHSVVSIDRALPAGPPQPDVRHIAADLRDLGQFVGAVQGCEALIHLAAHRAPGALPDPVVYVENTAVSYHALYAAAVLGISRVCLASSVNATGAAFSRRPRYDYFPLDEAHPTYNEDPYSLSKWVLEQQADSFARRYEDMQIASLRFHWLLDSYERAAEVSAAHPAVAARHLWAYTTIESACRACLLGVTADFGGHEVFYIVAPRTAVETASSKLARAHYPETTIRGDLAGTQGFFDCAKAGRLLGWHHEG